MPRIKYYDTNSGTWKYADKAIMGSEGPKNIISFEEQALNDEQKLQARINIGAVSNEEVNIAIENALGSGVGNVLKNSDVVDSLTSEVADKPLSANQGKVLNEAVVQVAETSESANEQAQINKKNIEDLQQDFSELSNSLGDLNFAPKYQYGTEDLEAGVSELETGVLYFVYE